MASEPWGFYEGAHPQLPGVAPGWFAQAHRAEAAERAREQREADERAARAQDRFDNWMWARMREKSFRGEAYDPNDPRTLMRTADELAEAVFVQQDIEAARIERRALIEAGLLHDLGPAHPDMTLPPEEALLEPAPLGAARGRHQVPLAVDPHADQSVVARARRALRRWSADDRARTRATERSKETWT